MKSGGIVIHVAITERYLASTAWGAGVQTTIVMMDCHASDDADTFVCCDTDTNHTQTVQLHTMTIHFT